MEILDQIRAAKASLTEEEQRCISAMSKALIYPGPETQAALAQFPEAFQRAAMEKFKAAAGALNETLAQAPTLERFPDKAAFHAFMAERFGGPDGEMFAWEFACLAHGYQPPATEEEFVRRASHHPDVVQTHGYMRAAEAAGALGAQIETVLGSATLLPPEPLH